MSKSIEKPADSDLSAAPCSLPPLPKKRVIHTVMPDDYRYGHVYGYTAKQMKEYARQAILSANTKDNQSEGSG